MSPTVTIRYCTRCNWLLRAAWYAQEILQTFPDSVRTVALQPENEIGGLFEIHLDDQRIWSRKEDGGFPEIKALKQTLRDRISPERDLGHIDGPDRAESPETP